MMRQQHAHPGRERSVDACATRWFNGTAAPEAAHGISRGGRSCRTISRRSLCDIAGASEFRATYGPGALRAARETVGIFRASVVEARRLTTRARARLDLVAWCARGCSGGSARRDREAIRIPRAPCGANLVTSSGGPEDLGGGNQVPSLEGGSTSAASGGGSMAAKIGTFRAGRRLSARSAPAVTPVSGLPILAPHSRTNAATR